MKKTSNRIVFFGNERLATGVTTPVSTLRKLVDAGYDVQAIVVNAEVIRSRHQRELEIEKVAQQHHIRLLKPRKLGDIADDIKTIGPEIGVLVAYGKIVPQAIIDLFPRGIINIHPSLLPAHRGPTPIESTIRNREPSTGVSIMQLVKAMDAGPVFAQKSLTLTGNESKQELADTLLEYGGSLLIKILPDILAERIHPTPQIDANATYDQLIQKQDGKIDWEQPAHIIEANIRAYAGWPGSSTTLLGKEVIITEVSAVEAEGTPGSISRTRNSLTVYCGKGAIAVHKLKPVNKKEMPIQAFLAGIR